MDDTSLQHCVEVGDSAYGVADRGGGSPLQKGDQRGCANYRGITLLSLPGKVYSKVLERRVRPIVRPGRGTTDQLFTLARILEGAWEYAYPVYMCFVDLEKAYERVSREILWGVLREYGVRGSLLRAIQSLYAKSESCVRILVSKSDSFPVGVGLMTSLTCLPTLDTPFLRKDFVFVLLLYIRFDYYMMLIPFIKKINKCHTTLVVIISVACKEIRNVIS